MQDAKLMKFSDPSDFFVFNNNGVGEGLLLEILGRLPSRAVTRLKLVCKSWCSLISSQYFITFFNHRRHDPSLPPIIHSSSSSSGFIFQSLDDRYFSIVVCGGYTHPDANLCGFRRLDLSFLPQSQSSSRIQLKGSCGDLILCSTVISQTNETLFYVCNHLTKQWAALPPAPQFQFTDIAVMAIGFLCVPAPCSLCTPSPQCGGVGVDNSRYNFVVVQICIFPVFRSKPLKVQLFYSEEGQWKTLLVSSPRPIRYRVRSSPFLIPYKGLLHLVAYQFILVFDPYNCPERFSRVIDMPTDMIDDEQNCVLQTMGVFQDRLRVTHSWHPYSEDPMFYIWELEDYNMGKWSLVHKIHLITCPRLLDLLDPHLDPKIRETGFLYSDGLNISAFYWTNSSGWEVGSGIVHWITDQGWPTPAPPLTWTTENDENTLGNS